MTALKKYQRLESPGLWRDAPDAQRREVVVSFGEASLVLSDPRTEVALSHWSLPAVERLNPGAAPALYAPGRDASETLEIGDADMIAALETVRGALARARARPGRLRGAVVLGMLVLVAGLGVFWLPGALERHAAAVIPPATRAAIGHLALADLARVAGAACADPTGQQALDSLGRRVFGDDPPQLVILRALKVPTLNLPGPIVVLDRALIDSDAGPEAVAGFALAELARAEATDPMIALLHHAGLRATVQVLTTGALPATAVAGYGATLLRTPATAVEEGALLKRFAAAELTSSPYAYALDPSGETTLGLIEADPFRAHPKRPVLVDGDWISLQAICGE
ncbi:MAG: hypothetical protein GW948_07640 [Rhodobacterales bacterium]|nr:hypothetical protein [Rhodobacterales bacterium]